MIDRSTRVQQQHQLSHWSPHLPQLPPHVFFAPVAAKTLRHESAQRQLSFKLFLYAKSIDGL